MLSQWKIQRKRKKKKSKLHFFFKRHNTCVVMESRWEMRRELYLYLWILQYKLARLI